MVIGILLPNSTTHPLISHNFMAGLRGALTQLAPDLSPELHTTTIGFGTDADLMLKEAEMMLLDKGVDVLIVFADHPIVACLFPLINAMKKLLIVVNGGAKYVPAKKQPYVIYHTLNYALNCRLTGKYAADLSKQAVMATSFYDGGYSLCHAISKGYMDKGSAVAFNFVSKFKAEEFDIKPLSGFLTDHPEINNVLAIYSDLSPVFYEKLCVEFPDVSLNVFVNSAMLDDFHLPESGVTNKEISIHAFVPWAIGIKNIANGDYSNAFKNKTGRIPDAIGALGWDTGILLLKYNAISLENPLFNTKQVLAGLLDLAIDGAKGELYIDSITHQVLSPAYRVKLGADNHLVVEDEVLMKEVLQEWAEICDDPHQGYVSGWINTYMCS